jgi:hypothetical protein
MGAVSAVQPFRATVRADASVAMRPWRCVDTPFYWPRRTLPGGPGGAVAVGRMECGRNKIVGQRDATGGACANTRPSPCRDVQTTGLICVNAFDVDWTDGLNTRWRKDLLSGQCLPVMPAKASIHAFPGLRRRQAWMAARSLSSGLTRGAAMTELQRRWVIVSASWYDRTGDASKGFQTPAEYLAVHWTPYLALNGVPHSVLLMGPFWHAWLRGRASKNGTTQ